MSNYQYPLSITSSLTLITSSLTPTWATGTIGYLQVGTDGTPLGLLASLTMTPQYVKVIMTDQGLKRIN